MKISFLGAYIYKNKNRNKIDAEHFLILAGSNIHPWIHELIKKRKVSFISLRDAFPVEFYFLYSVFFKICNDVCWFDLLNINNNYNG